MGNRNTLVILMMKLNIKSEYNKIRILTKMEMKRILNHVSNIILLVLLAVLFVNVFVSIAQSNSIKIESKIGLAIEDDSLELKTLLKNITDNKLKGILDFENSSFDKGLKLLENKDVIALIHVKKGTSRLLNNGEKASIDLYIRENSNITVKFLVEYLENLVDVLNEGQNGAMIYWNIMKAEGLDFNKRYEELNNIAINYMSAFLTRGNVFENSEDLDKFYGASLINYYFTTVLLIISILSAILFHLDINEDFKRGRIRRTLYSGYSLWHIYSSKILVGVAFTSILMVAFKTIFMLLFSTISIFEILRFIIYITLINIVIHMIVIIFYILIDKDMVRDWSFVIFFLMTSFAGGLFLPIYSMGEMFRKLSRINLLTIGHKLLSGHSITVERISIFILYFSILLVLIRYVHRKRSV